jgi:hypothetical protein
VVRLIDPIPPLRERKKQESLPDTGPDPLNNSAVQAWAPGDDLSPFDKSQLQAVAQRYDQDTGGTAAELKKRLEALPPSR